VPKRSCWFIVAPYSTWKSTWKSIGGLRDMIRGSRHYLRRTCHDSSSSLTHNLTITRSYGAVGSKCSVIP
jgi:hypothetical protein